MRPLTAQTLFEILRECAGEDESVRLDEKSLDLSFEALGYDSLALMETGSRIETRFGVKLPDDTVSEAETPRSLLLMVNDQLQQAA